MRIPEFNDFLFESASFLFESASYKKKSDFSGIKWGATLIGNREYTFKSGGHDYILIFNIDQVLSDKEYILTSDIRTKKKEFELIKSQNPFELSSTVKDIHKEVLEDFKKYGYDVKGLKIYYSREPGETKNVRAIFFNRAINSALKDLGIKYDTKDFVDIKSDKYVYEYKFK